VQGRYFLGQVIEGTVVHKADFGVFVELEDGVEGLVHVSELNNSAGEWGEQYKEGTKIQAIILAIDPRDRKISLSEKAAEEGGSDDNRQGGQAYTRQPSSSTARLGDIMGDIARNMSRNDE
jgi:small subunit ribosomal protein S1